MIYLRAKTAAALYKRCSDAAGPLRAGDVSIPVESGECVYLLPAPIAQLFGLPEMACYLSVFKGVCGARSRRYGRPNR